MFKLRLRPDGFYDRRHWWICPKCELLSVFFTVPPVICSECGTILPNTETLKAELSTRILFFETGSTTRIN